MEYINFDLPQNPFCVLVNMNRLKPKQHVNKYRRRQLNFLYAGIQQASVTAVTASVGWCRIKPDRCSIFIHLLLMHFAGLTTGGTES